MENSNSQRPTITASEILRRLQGEPGQGGETRDQIRRSLGLTHKEAAIIFGAPSLKGRKTIKPVVTFNFVDDLSSSTPATPATPAQPATPAVEENTNVQAGEALGQALEENATEQTNSTSEEAPVEEEGTVQEESAAPVAESVAEEAEVVEEEEEDLFGNDNAPSDMRPPFDR